MFWEVTEEGNVVLKVLRGADLLLRPWENASLVIVVWFWGCYIDVILCQRINDFTKGC